MSTFWEKVKAFLIKYRKYLLIAGLVLLLGTIIVHYCVPGANVEKVTVDADYGNDDNDEVKNYTLRFFPYFLVFTLIGLFLYSLSPIRNRKQHWRFLALAVLFPVILVSVRTLTTGTVFDYDFLLTGLLGIIFGYFLGTLTMYNLKKYRNNAQEFGSSLLNSPALEVLGSAIILIIVGLISRNIKVSLVSFDFDMFLAIIASFVFYGLVKIAKGYFTNKLEDSIKLTTKADSLVKKYSGSYELFYKAETTSEDGITSTVFPTIVDCIASSSRGLHLEVADTDKMKYELPEMVKENYARIFQSHETSNVYNQLNIRVDDWEHGPEENQWKLYTSRTTYYNSLVTNRALDYRFDELSVRELYAYGPYVPELKSSVLSNHLGFNGFIISSDGFIPFVKRNERLSIGKRLLGTSVSASLKAKYALNENGLLDEAGIFNSINKEILDELKIEENTLNGTIVIAAYRDIVEGGKPQLLMVSKTSKSKEQIESDFRNNNHVRKAASKEEEFMEDGEKLEWVSVVDLLNGTTVFETDRMILPSSDKLQTELIFPISTTATVSVFRDWLKEHPDYIK